MKSPSDEKYMIHSWHQAWRSRCCPPDHLLTGPATPELDNHLDICPLCRRDRADNLPSISLDIAGVGLPAASLQPGELCSFVPGLAGWGPKSRYFTPPVVLILARVDEHAVQVAQTCGYPALAANDDILLDNDLIGFVEPWNRYTMNVHHLGPCLGRVTDALLDTVDALTLPITDSNFSPVPGSLLWFFRNMEVETGYFFAAQSVSTLPGIQDEPLQLVDPVALKEDLKRLPLVVPELSAGLFSEDMLAAVKSADDLFPLAAADAVHAEDVRVDVLVFQQQDNRIVGVKLVFASITMRTFKENTFTESTLTENELRISGTCSACPEHDAHWIFRWQSNEHLLRPLPGQYGVQDNTFWAVFPMEDLELYEQGELIVRIIHTL